MCGGFNRCAFEKEFDVCEFVYMQSKRTLSRGREGYFIGLEDDVSEIFMLNCI